MEEAWLVCLCYRCRFTPDNEPYLGRELLFQLDNLISPYLELNSKCAPVSHGRPLSSLQRALCILVPQTITLALSIRELIRQGYLFEAKVLVRPITERRSPFSICSRTLTP